MMERCHTWLWHEGGETFRGRSVASDTSYEFIGRYIGWPVLRQQLAVGGAPCPVRNRLKSTTVKRTRFEMTDRPIGVIAIIDRFQSFPIFYIHFARDIGRWYRLMSFFFLV